MNPRLYSILSIFYLCAVLHVFYIHMFYYIAHIEISPNEVNVKIFCKLSSEYLMVSAGHLSCGRALFDSSPFAHHTAYSHWRKNRGSGSNKTFDINCGSAKEFIVLSNCLSPMFYEYFWLGCANRLKKKS